MLLSLKTSLRLAVAAALALNFVGMARAQLLVVPGNNATTEGNSNNYWPFFNGSSEAMRYQQVYGSSAFTALSGAAWITEMAFRADSLNSSFSLNNGGIQLSLSTTQAGPD